MPFTTGIWYLPRLAYRQHRIEPLHHFETNYVPSATPAFPHMKCYTSQDELQPPIRR